jgi:hypothetical protein
MHFPFQASFALYSFSIEKNILKFNIRIEHLSSKESAMSQGNKCQHTLP